MIDLARVIIEIEFIFRDGDAYEYKTGRLPAVPRVGEPVCYANNLYMVTNVLWIPTYSPLDPSEVQVTCERQA